VRIYSSQLPKNLTDRHLRQQINRAGQAVYDASEPIRQTEAYKVVSTSVAEALDDIGDNTRYGGFVEKEARRKRREARLKKLGKDGMAKRPLRVPENPECVAATHRASLYESDEDCHLQSWWECRTAC
jgi:import inner membrane translocase subunit TIM44